MRIKLPGSKRLKVIILIICSIIAVSILVKEGINNRREKQIINERIEAQKQEDKEKAKEIQKKAEKQKENKQEELDSKAGKADALFYSRKYDDAIKLAEEVINEDEKNYKAYNVLGITKIFKYRNLDGMKDIDKSLDIKNDYGYAMFNKGLGYELLGYFDEAIKWYKKDLEIEEYSWSYYGIASIYGRRNDAASTVKYLKKAIELNPSAKETAKDEHDFDPVRNDKRFIELLQ